MACVQKNCKVPGSLRGIPPETTAVVCKMPERVKVRKILEYRSNSECSGNLRILRVRKNDGSVSILLKD